MAVCSAGHEVEEHARFCPECGDPLDPVADDYPRPVSVSTLFADAPFFFLGVVAVACVVMFVWALVGAGTANSQDKLKTYAYLSGLGATPWLLAALVAVGLASWRASKLVER